MKARDDVLAELAEFATLPGKAKKLAALDAAIASAEAEYKAVAAELNKARRHKEQIDSELAALRKRFEGELNI